MTDLRTAAAVFELQRGRDMAWSRVAGCGDPSVLTGAERSHLAERQAEFELLDAELREARSAIGGRVYRVPDANLDGLAKRVSKVNRRAAKLGVEPVHYVATSETWTFERKSETTGEVVEVVPHTFVIVGAQVVKMAGWQFAATIEHDEEGNIIRQVPGVEADLAAYRTAAPWCFHCRTIRKRVDTFVVLHEDGRTEQVGRNCLVDFLGADAVHAARRAEWLIELESAFEDAEHEGSTSARGIEAIALDEFLTHVAMSIRTGRWTSRGTAREYGFTATADHAERNLRECRRAGYREPRERDTHELPTAEDRETAVATIEWARAEWCAKPVDERSDFEHNMAVALAHDYLPTRRTGLAAYAVQGRRKAVEVQLREATAAKSKAESEFVGTKGERLKGLRLTLVRAVELTDYYNGGTKPLYIFVDDAGNGLVWKASSWSAGIEQGGTYEITATVAGHETHETYGKQTKLLRCKVTGEIDTESEGS